MGHSAEMESLGGKAAKDEALHARVTKVDIYTPTNIEPKEAKTCSEALSLLDA